MHLPRRRFNRLVLASAALSLGTSARSQPPRLTPAKVRFGYLYANPFAALVAYEQGYFKDEALEVELIPVQNGPAAVAATATGAVDLSFGDILGWASGLASGFTNVKLVLPGTYDANADLLVREDSKLQAPADFKGKRIGVSPAPMVAVSIKAWLDQAGVDPASVSFVIIPTNGDGQALARGDVDAVVTFEPATSRMVLQQKAVSLLDPTQVAPPKGATFTAYYGNAAFLQKEPVVTERFLRALRRGVVAYNTLPALESARIRGKYSGIDLVKLSQSVPGLLERFRLGKPQVDGVNLAATQGWIDRAVKYGGVPRSVDIAPHVLASALVPTVK